MKKLLDDAGLVEYTAKVKEHMVFEDTASGSAPEGSIIQWEDADGTVDESLDMTGATSTANGKHGFVPAPSAGDQEAFLKGDGTWGDVEYEEITDFVTSWLNNCTQYSTYTPKLICAKIGRLRIYTAQCYITIPATSANTSLSFAHWNTSKVKGTLHTMGDVAIGNIYGDSGKVNGSFSVHLYGNGTLYVSLPVATTESRNIRCQATFWTYED